MKEDYPQMFDSKVGDHRQYSHKHLYIAFYAHATGQLKIVTINRTMDCTCMCYCANSVDIDCNLDKEYGSMAIS